MPEQIIEKIKKRIQPQWKVCFLSSLLVGLIAHVYKITNWLPNWDSLVFRYDSQDMLSMGRWFLSVVCSISSFYDLPVIAGFLSIIIHSIGAVCICNIFKIEKNVTAALVGALVVTFPTVTSVMIYNYVADGYSLAFLFSCIATMLLCRKKPNFSVAVILITLSVAIYQAYITVTITLLLMYLLFELIYEDSQFKKIMLMIGRFFSAGAIGMILYYLLLILLLKVTGTEVLEYQGFDKAASFTGINIFESLYFVKNIFINYFFDFSQGINAFVVLNIIVSALTVIMYITDIIRNRVNFLKVVMILILSFMLPIGANVLCFLNSSIDYHNLMKMGYIVFYLFFILQYEKTNFTKPKMNYIKLWTVFIVTIVLVCNYMLIANISYHKLTMAYEKSIGTLIRIADRIEQTEGADKCKKIVIIGQLPESEAYGVVLPPDMTGTTDGYILRADDEIVGQSVLCSALNDYCKTEYEFLAGDAKQDIVSKADAANMGDWPAKNSVTIIDDVIVIKLSEVR